MAKERSEEKKDKKEKKSTKASDDGVKKSKKDKKDKKSRKSDVDVSMADGDDTEVADVTNALSEALEGDKTEVDGDLSVVKTSADVEINGVNKEQLLAAMVPFANPMADEKSMKKVLKGVKKGTSPFLKQYVDCFSSNDDKAEMLLFLRPITNRFHL